ncbi:MAG: hypothetical protein ABS76_13110 [Pelagibacterium sp. SCN 64-44]|nr:MAG: hypothetical protein ABS76_13110 [Pelagibacterium sp. SCN 64-44]
MRPDDPAYAFDEFRKGHIVLKSIIAIALAIGCLPVAAYEPERGVSAAGLFRICGASDPMWIGVCYGYGLAVAEMFDATGTRFCIEEVEPEKVVNAIRKTLYGRTDLHFMPGARAVVMAFDEHFPC